MSEAHQFALSRREKREPKLPLSSAWRGQHQIREPDAILSAIVLDHEVDILVATAGEIDQDAALLALLASLMA